MPATRRSVRVASQQKHVEEKKPNTKLSSTPPVKRAKLQSSLPSQSPTKKIKRSDSSQAVDANDPLGMLDPELPIDGNIILVDYEPADVMLMLKDPDNDADTFFVLQCIKCDVAAKDSYIVYTRWGRTGTSGQALQEEFDNEDNAIKTFEQKFEQKTGLAWANRREPYKGGKYRFLSRDSAQRHSGYTGAKWQYYVDDGVDGKEEGWYDYDSVASEQVEQHFHETGSNPHLANRRVVSGSWSYDVALNKMIQTNTIHPAHTSRRTRRCADDAAMPDDATSSSKSTPEKVSSSAAVASLPAFVASSGPVPCGVLSSALPASPSPKSLVEKRGGHPVDQDVLLMGRSASDFEVVQAKDGNWFDVVLNQCNITGSSNNNKYYRLQLLRDYNTGEYFCWQKWGRVGEKPRASSSKLEGGFAGLENGLIKFLKKYKDKTGNQFNAHPFLQKTGKYVPIDVDNNVQVKEDVQSSSIKRESDYLPSKLDTKTKELVEVLFSKEMRNEALSEFNLDLQRLPLGVPSEQQILHGLSILKEIEKKLNGIQVDEPFDELSSRFYTAIPHSFGRSRPPSIDDRSSLQSRYDMCDVLLDMHSTNETCRKIAEEFREGVTQVPPPVDKHYDTLKAQLRVLDRSSTHFKMIETYFDTTKGSYSSAKLLDVWCVERDGEQRRFQKFDEVGNRQLLWHGTNIAVVAPILTSGLRIMPHSGGRLGAGIYLANMQEKSAQYTSGYGSKFACMFLSEAALGKEYIVEKDGSHASSLKKAPNGFDSVHAIGNVSPTAWTTMEIDGKMVSLSQGSGKKSSAGSTFHHDEHLCYDEEQVRIRYMITVKQ